MQKAFALVQDTDVKKEKRIGELVEEKHQIQQKCVGSSMEIVITETWHTVASARCVSLCVCVCVYRMI